MGTAVVMYTLKTARERTGMTQAEAAKSLGISVDTLGNYERGKSYPDVPILKRIESLYGVAYDQIIFLPLEQNRKYHLRRLHHGGT